MSFTNRILLGLAAGVVVGLAVGERDAVFRSGADAFVKLLQDDRAAVLDALDRLPGSPSQCQTFETSFAVVCGVDRTVLALQLGSRC
jgi:hypothetical protein